MLDELIPQPEAERILSPHLEAIQGAIEGGWADWMEAVAAAPKLATARTTTRANAVYDRITERAEEYSESAGVPTTRKRQMLTVSLGEGLLILRFKKFRGRSLRTSGVPTQQRLEMEAQQVTLDGVHATYVVAGYLPDELGLGLDVLAVVCSYNGVIVWRIALGTDGGDGSVRPIYAVPPQGPVVRSARRAQEEEVEGR